MTTQASNPFYIPATTGDSAGSEWEPLDVGTYNGVCVGATIKEGPSFKDPTQMMNKLQLVLQIVEGGQHYYLRTKPMTLSTAESSNLWGLMSGWCPKMTYAHFAKGFDVTKLIGFGAQVVVMQHEYNGRMYADIANLLPLRRGVKVDVVPDEVPSFLANGVKAQIWAEGITVKQPDVAPVAATQPQQPFGTVQPQPAPAPAVPPQEQAPQVDDDGDSLPF